MIVCPLCGRASETRKWNSKIPNDPTEIKNQIRNLESVLNDLRNDTTSILYYSENQYRMCPMCQEIMENIETEENREEFEEKINQQIENLEEKTEDMLTGTL